MLRQRAERRAEEWCIERLNGRDGLGGIFPAMVNVYEALLQRGIIVRPVANYGMPKHLRVTVGRADENARFLNALERVLHD